MKNFDYFYILFAAVNILVSVLVSALSAHFMTERSFVITQAITMQQLHSLMIIIYIVTGLKKIFEKKLYIFPMLLAFGILFFCLNIYMVYFFQINFFSVLTPLGGSCFILGWVFFIVSIFLNFKKKK